MRRRDFLASLPVTASLAGCSGGPESSTSDRGTADSDAPNTSERDSPAVTQSPATTTRTASVGPDARVRLYSAYRYNYETDLIGVRPPERDQFAVVKPPRDTPRPAPDEFTLELGDQQFSPEPLTGEEWPIMPGIKSGYESMYHENRPTGPSRSGWLVFEVPVVEFETAALVHQDIRYPLPEAQFPKFAASPEFTLESISVPETVSKGEPVSLSVEVTNAGDRAGVFLGGWQKEAYPQSVDISLAPGETGSATTTYDGLYNSWIRFVYAAEELEFAVEVTTDQPN